jgi:hypothetical protein
VALAALAAAGLGVAAAPARGGDEGGAAPPRGRDGGTPDAGGQDRDDGDEELVRHLEELEKLDLLMNLDLFDEKSD